MTASIRFQKEAPAPEGGEVQAAGSAFCSSGLATAIAGNAPKLTNETGAKETTLVEMQSAVHSGKPRIQVLARWQCAKFLSRNGPATRFWRAEILVFALLSDTSVDS